MATTAEAQFDAVVNQPFALETGAHTGVGEQVGSSLLEHSGADALFNVLAAASLDYNRFDSLQMEKMRQHQSRGARPDDPDLRAQAHLFAEIGAYSTFNLQCREIKLECPHVDHRFPPIWVAGTAEPARQRASMQSAPTEAPNVE